MAERWPVTMQSGVATSCRTDRDTIDVAMVSRVKAGDSTAYAPLWDRYWPWLCGYFRAQIGNREEAEDLAGATLLAAFEQLNRFRGEARPLVEPPPEPISETAEAITTRCTFKTYLGAIARHKLARCLRQRMIQRCRNFTEMCGEALEDADQGIEALVGSDADMNPLSQLLYSERLEETSCALAYVGLRSNDQFKALLFHYACGLAHREVAEILGLRDETVNTRLQEGRRKLNRFYQALSDEATTAVS
jgi:RNA polymerase sigma factor (sigma-70 family)